MNLLRQLLFALYSLYNKVILKLNHVDHESLDIDGTILIHNKGEIKISAGGKINSSPFKNIIGGDTRSSIVVKKEGRLTIGKNFRMSNSAIYCADRITIGDDVMIGGSCKIWDTDFHPLDAAKRLNNPNAGYNTKPITIGNKVFIGGFSIVLKGVTVGEGSIIGAGSVVSRDVPAGEIWAGNPASFVRKTI